MSCVSRSVVLAIVDWLNLPLTVDQFSFFDVVFLRFAFFAVPADDTKSTGHADVTMSTGHTDVTMQLILPVRV